MKLFQSKRENERKRQEEAAAATAGLGGEAAQPALRQSGERPGPAEPADLAQEAAPEETTGEFSLSYEPEGVYLTLSCSRPLTLQEQERLVRHLSRKKLKDMDMETVLPAITEAKAERLLVAPAQAEVCYNETFTATVSTDAMEAAITLQPPEPEKGERLTLERILADLEKNYRVIYGIDQEAIKALLENPVYDEPRVIARGVPPVTGEDGRLEWHIERREGSAVYRIRQVGEDEKADYKNLDLFVQVRPDQLLVTRVPPKEGTPGRTVLNREVPAQTGKNYLLPRGKNTYITEDGLELHASIAGRVDEVNGCLEVSTFYHVIGDVDLSVGNIDFDGDVVIEGNVLSGFTIKATGSIEVKGIVEASALEAGGDIILQSGIQGGGKGMLQAKDGVSMRFAEYATIQAGSVVSAESLLHSNVSCFGAVEVLGGKGSIIGGNICAGTYIAANYLGTSSGRATELEVGLSPQHRVKLAEMEKTAASLKRQVERMQSLLEETPEAGVKNQREKKMRMENVRKLLQYKKMMLDAEEELGELKGTLEENKNGQVHVLHTAYPGVSVTIGLARTLVDQPTSYATFRLTEGEVTFTNCRFKQRPVRLKKKRR